MRKLLLTWMCAGAAQLTHAQWMAGLSLVNTALWPQPILTVPVPETTAARQEKQAPPPLVPGSPAVQANARALAANFPAQDEHARERAINCARCMSKARWPARSWR